MKTTKADFVIDGLWIALTTAFLIQAIVAAHYAWAVVQTLTLLFWFWALVNDVEHYTPAPARTPPWGGDR